MSANFDMTDLRLRLRDFLAEPIAAFWSDNELEDIINDVQREIAQTACCYQIIDAQVTTTEQNRAVAALADSYRIAAMEFIPTAGHAYALRKILPRQIGHIADTNNPNPQCWLEYGSTAGIDPLPAAVHALHAYLCAPPPEISPAPNLRVGSNATRIATDSFIFMVSGALMETILTEDSEELTTEAGVPMVTYSIGARYKPAANPTGTAPTGSAIPAYTYGAWRLEISSDQVIDAVAATDNATGYASAALALAGLPELQEEHIAVGTVTVINTAGIFTPGVTSFQAAGVTAIFTDDPDLTSPSQIPRQFWTLILLGSMARALGKYPRYGAAARQLSGMFVSELRFVAFDYYEQAPDAYMDMGYRR